MSNPDEPHSSAPTPGEAASEPNTPDSRPPYVANEDSESLVPPSVWERVERTIQGAPISLKDRSIFHKISLIPFLAWVGLGADGLSSSAYGPEEAFLALGQHVFLAIAIAGAMIFTIVIISTAYVRIIEQFPFGGGGYVVATALLGEKAGVVAGSALMVDYVLTISISTAAAGDALFSFVHLREDQAWIKLSFEGVLLLGLIALNIRGVRESVKFLAPIFMLFIVTHVIVILGGIGAHFGDIPALAGELSKGAQAGNAELGFGGLIMLFFLAYSLGGGTYTGIEAVSNGLMILRPPRERTAKITMVYMATSLAFTASGLLLCYLLWDVVKVPGKTLNASLVETMTQGIPGGRIFTIVTLLSEGALLIVAAQAGLIGGPRVLANMANDSWVPHRFGALSERLTTQNGIMLLGLSALVAIVATKGKVSLLVVMYSINVFMTFSLAMFGMARWWWRARKESGPWRGRFALFAVGFVLCASILAITTFEKFMKGGYITLLVTSASITVCILIRRHYRQTAAALAKLFENLDNFPKEPDAKPGPLERNKPTAVVLVGSYGGLGIHTAMNVFRAFPNYYKNMVFISVGVIDSTGFKGPNALRELEQQARTTLRRYTELANGLGIPAEGRMAIGLDAVDEIETLCVQAAKDFPRSTFFAGKVIFKRETWLQAFLHNETALAVQKRLQWAGHTVVIIPARVR